VPGHPYEQGFDLRLVPDKLTEPLRWKKPRRVFVNSMSDLFQDGVPDSYIDQVFAVMALCQQHTFQVLTKRAERMRSYFDDDLDDGDPTCMLERWADAALTIQPLGEGENATDEAASRYEEVTSCDWPLPNVWLGMSVENQHFADERIPMLLQTPAAVRFISAEPLLEALDLKPFLSWRIQTDGWNGRTEHFAELPAEGGTRGLDWVIVGGESGPGARPFNLAWASSIVGQCKSAGIACFIKQLGKMPYEGSASPYTSGPEARNCRLYELDIDKGHGGNPVEWPADLRVREFPTVATT
jgi:protein gp37